MDRYHESATIVSEEAARRLVDEHKARVWRNPRSGVTRFYLSVDALEDLSPSLGRIAPRGRAENGDTHSCVAALIARCECGVQNTKKPLFYQNSLLHWWVYGKVKGVPDGCRSW